MDLTTQRLMSAAGAAPGINWAGYELPAGNVAFAGIAWGANKFVAPGWVSTDGISWVAGSASTSGAEIAWTGTQFVNIGFRGFIETSPDGVTWTTRVASGAAGTPSLAGVAGSGSLIVAVGESGAIRTSPDGATWTTRSSGTSNYLTAVTWSGALFVAVGFTGTILTSPDGVTWTTRTSGTTVALQCVTWNGSLFLIGGNGFVLTSPDGVTWTNRPVAGTTAGFSAFGAATSTSTLLLIFGTTGIWSSADGGVNWVRRRTSDGGAEFSGVAWNGVRFVAVTPNRYYYISP